MKLFVTTSSFPDRSAVEVFLGTDAFVFAHSDEVLVYLFGAKEQVPTAQPAELAQSLRRHVSGSYGCNSNACIVFASSRQFQIDWQNVGAHLLAE